MTTNEIGTEFWFTIRSVRPDGTRGNFSPAPHGIIRALSSGLAIQSVARTYGERATNVMVRIKQATT